MYKAPGEPDALRFQGDGLSFKAKLIGVEDVPENRGDRMCQEAMFKLKNAVRLSGDHKQRVFVNVSLEGLKIVDAVTLAVLYSHPVHRISFISRDTTDARAFGYVYAEKDEKHKFYAIKTAAAAELLVYTIRDLFQAVYDIKKKEMAETKQKLERGEIDTKTVEGNSMTPRNGSTSGTGQTPPTTQNAEEVGQNAEAAPQNTGETPQKAEAASQNAEGESIYQVPPNNAPVKPEPAEQVANLLDLEDQTEKILEGIEQIKNLDFNSIIDESPASPESPPTSPPDPWGLGSVSAPTGNFLDSDDVDLLDSDDVDLLGPGVSSASAMGDLMGLQASPAGQGSAQPFPGSSPFPAQAPFGAQPGFGPSASLPVTKDPFARDPFSANAQPRPGFPASNPFSGNTGFPPQQPYGMAPRAPGFMGPPAGFGAPMAAPPGAAPGNPFGMAFGVRPGAPTAPSPQPQQQGSLFGDTAADNANLLQPMRSNGSGQPVKEEAPAPAAAVVEEKKTSNDLFGDLVDIKKSPSASRSFASPKELFAKANVGEKKSMNAMKAEQNAPPAQNGEKSLFG